MYTIKFSHDYPKLHGQYSAELLAVRPIKINAHTPDELLGYDTSYWDEVTPGGSVKAHYPLPMGDCIQLIFLGNVRIPFCTIRSAYPPNKVEYYKQAVGKVFTIWTPSLEKCRNCQHYVDDTHVCWLANVKQVPCEYFRQKEGGR